ncbi:NADPH-dependent FMN reductase [Actinophytocola sp.]|uniref:NADPH-dependent FMN reductase n=1 Tax=Actinophytocola sp. TaxID=1872138 RepID=UPI002ED20B65
MSSIVALAGSPSTESRTVALLRHIAGSLDGHDVHVVPVRALPADALLGADTADPAISAVVRQVTDADGLIVASPVYKAAYSGVLKTFLDLLPANALAGKAVLPVLTGAAPVHALAVDYALRPVLAALGARHVVQGLFLIDKQIERTPDGVVLAPDVQASVDAAVDGLTSALPGVLTVRS